MEMVTFQHNETRKSVAVDIVDDAIYEGPESFQVVLRPVSSGAAVDGTPSWITILDEDDCKPQIKLCWTPWNPLCTSF